MLKKLITAAAAAGLVLGLANPSSAATWRSNSGRTFIPNLDSICWGNNRVDSVQTVFGGGSYAGSMTFNYAKTGGCWEINTYPIAQGAGVTAPAGTALVFAPPSNVRATPNGTIICSVSSVRTINIYGSTNGWYQTDVCGAMGYIHRSQIRAQGAGVTAPAGTALVFAPPSNVRATPNGTIICSVSSVRAINIYGSTNGWYQTDVCGAMGYIHRSQIRF
ncbi:MAG: hypothetical protein AB4426_09940 [Xenococcaceae cyanobacterium]